MPYTNEMNFGDWVYASSAKGNALIKAIEEGKVLYDKWYQLSYGKTDQQIADLPQFTGRAVTDIQVMARTVGVLNEIYLALHGGEVTQFNRIDYLTPVL